MKYLSIAIPCYNSQDYMAKAIESCLILKDDVEVIMMDQKMKRHVLVMNMLLVILKQLNVFIRKMVGMDKL